MARGRRFRLGPLPPVAPRLRLRSGSEVVVDGNQISSRTPDDLPAFMRAVIEKLGG